MFLLNMPIGIIAQQEQAVLDRLAENSNYQTALQAQVKEEWDEARASYKLALTDVEKQKDWDAFIVLIEAYAATYARQKDYKDGIDFCTNALLENKTALSYQQEEKIRYAIGKIHHTNKDWEGAFTYWQEYLTFLKDHYPLNSNWKYAEAYWWIAIGEKYDGVRDKEIDHLLNAKAIITKLLSEQVTLEKDSPEYVILERVFREISWYYIYHSGEVEKSQAILEESIALMKLLFGKETPEAAYYYFALGDTYRMNLEEYNTAIEYYDKALYALKDEDPFEEFGFIYLTIAQCYTNLGKHEKAIEYLKPCLGVDRGILGVPRYKIDFYINFGAAYLKIGDIESCEQYLKKADQLLQEFTQVVKDKRESLHIQRGLRYQYAQLYKKTGRSHLVKNNYLEMANDYPVEETPDADIPILTDITQIYLQEGKIDSALHYNSRALSNGFHNGYQEKDGMSPNLDDLVGSSSFYKVLKQRILIWMMKAQSSSNQAQQIKYFDKAIAGADFSDVVHLHYLQKMNVIRASESRNIIQRSISNYRQGILAASTYNTLYPNKEAIQKGFYFTQKMKAQQLWMALLASEAKRVGKLDESILEKEASLMNQITNLEKEIEKALEAKDTVTYNRLKFEDLFEQKEAHAALQELIEQAFPDYYAYKYNFTAETEQSLSVLLQPSEVLIEYVITDSSLLIFTLSKDAPIKLFDVPIDTTLLGQLRHMNELLQNSTMNRPGSRNKFLAASHALYQQFIKPIETELEEKSRLIIIGDLLTNYIPFEALASTAESLPFSEVDFLIRRFEISYHYSSSLFAKARRIKQNNEATNIFAFAPVYDLPKSTRTEEDTTISDIAFTADGLRAFDENGTYTPLPESAREVETIVQLFEEKGYDNNMLAMRKAAHEANLKANLAGSYRFIHIAGHSFANLNNPKFSGIACIHSEATNNQEDGILFTSEIYNLNIQADLVSLSSCESGYGKVELSEGIIGLNRAVIYAGGSNVLFSLWKVFDKISADLMINFYEEVLFGKSYAAALRSAKLNILNNKSTASPHYWSPFLLIGR